MKLALFAALASTSCLPSASSSVTSPPSSLAPSPHDGWSFFASAKNAATARRRSRNRRRPPSSLFGVPRDGGGRDRIIGEESLVLDESDFEFDEDDYHYGTDEESVYSNSLRGGGVSATAAAVGGWPGLRGGTLEMRKKNGRRRSNNDKRSLGERIESKRREKTRRLENLQREKMRQFRKTFRQKQRQFQSRLYILNSRLDGEFPKPPYSLWKLDDEPAFGKTTLTGKIFWINVAVFGLQTMYPRLTAMGAKRSDLILQGRQLHRLITPVFLHGGVGHLLANGYSLRSVGANVERSFGTPRLLATYLVSGVAGNVLSAIRSPNPAVGASGAIFGLVGAYYTFLSNNQALLGRSAQMQKSALLETIGINLALGMTNPMIDNWGHAGGFIGGVGMAHLIGPRLYAARIPLGGSDESAAAGIGAGRVVIDRPAVSFRVPDAVREGMLRANECLAMVGDRALASVRGFFGGRGEREYFLDGAVDYAMGGVDGGNGDGTIYRTLKEEVRLEGNVNLSPSDGFRQDVSELDPTNATTERRKRPQRRPMPKSGNSLRPRYGHLYR